MEEMGELFYKDEYLRAFDARVIFCEAAGKGFAVVLENTAFYPEGGGQPADHGTLGAARVFDVKRKDGAVIHYTDKALPVGDVVHGEIDWDRRFDHMQQHSGEHIISGLVYHRFGYDNVGFHMNEAVTIDFNGPMTWEEALSIERAANDLIYQNVCSVVTYPSREELAKIDYRSKKELTGKIRLVEFPGADICACCGTHVARTGEIGCIKITGLMNHRDGVRMTLLCGRRAMAYMDRIHDADQEVARLFSVKPLETAKAAEKAKEDIARLNAALHEAQRRYFRMKAEMLPAGRYAVLAEEGMTPGELRKGADILAESGAADVYLLLSEAAGRVNYVIASAKEDVRPFGKALNAKCAGRGGGTKEAVQGSLAVPLAAVRAAAEDIFKIS